MSAELDPLYALRHRLEIATRAAFGDEAAGTDPALHRSAHADYQADLAMALGRKLKRNPREVAAALVERLAADEVLTSSEVSGPGFINLTLRPAFVSAQLTAMSGDPRLGVPAAAHPQTVVVDYSAPNAAKEMHVGHLRPTVIGDAVVRLLERLGHRVIRQNHIGDWGTPFGMLIEELHDRESAGGESTVKELVEFYKSARTRFDADPAFADRARKRVVLLQGGDAETLALWRKVVDRSVDYMQAVYERMSVTLRPQDVAGESHYNDQLAAVVAELESKGLARESEGAICVFPPGFTGRDDQPLPLIVRKQDGGYGYATTDLAALRYRMQVLKADRAIYVVGAPQSQHLAMVFAVGRLAGWIPEGVRVEHAPFGSVLGPDKKMFRTRGGETVNLVDLLDEAIERATKVVAEKSPELDPGARATIAAQVGMGAIKYADLCNDRVKDYIFDWDRMLSFDGNTAPYLMYAHARCRSILRKGGGATSKTVTVEAPEERALGLELLGLAAILNKAEETIQPHRVCGFLYSVASAYSAFFEKCPVLKAEEPVRSARLALCDLTARTLALGLDVLGIAAPEQM
jgi:arginyl-tRNA synthetase